MASTTSSSQTAPALATSGSSQWYATATRSLSDGHRVKRSTVNSTEANEASADSTEDSEESVSFQERVINGEDVDIEKLPYQAALEYRNRLFCGGSVIAPSWILTAAHCIDRRLWPSRWRVRVGSSFRESGGLVAEVRTLTAHPKHRRLRYDVALVELRVALVFSLSVNAVRLPNHTMATEPTPHTTLTISGWGRKHPHGFILPKRLQRARVTVIDRVICNASYTELSQGPIGVEEICAGGGLTDTCQGDSGGPLVDDAGVLQGVTSWGEGCAMVDYPGVYAYVGHPELREFIRKVSGV